MEGLSDWLSITSEALLPYAGYVFVIAAIFTRLSIFIFLVPSIGERTINMRVRITLALAVTWMMLPGILASPLPHVTQMSTAILLIVKNATVGFFLGFSLRLLVFVLQILGNIASQSMSISQPLGEGIATEPNTTLSTVFMLAGTTLLVTLDFHITAFGLLYDSYAVMPLDFRFDIDGAAYDLTQRAVDVFRISLSLAFPFVLLNFIYNLLLGFVNRAMPQLLVSFVGMPAIIGVGMILLAITAATILQVWMGYAAEQSRSFGF